MLTRPRDGDRKPCPRCGGVAEFRTIHSTPGPAIGSGFVKYDPAWVCGTPACRYYEANSVPRIERHAPNHVLETGHEKGGRS